MLTRTYVLDYNTNIAPGTLTIPQFLIIIIMYRHKGGNHES